MATFSKTPKTLQDQVLLLQSRGMTINQPTVAEFYLSQINYYRLSAYWLPFESNHTTHIFKSSTTFEQVLELYSFDRELRLLLLDAIERIEIAIRSHWAYELAHLHGTHAHMDVSIHKSFKIWNANLTKLLSELDRAKDEDFIKHYLQNYQKPELPPVWVICEVMSFGQLSRWYQQLAPSRTRRAIAKHFDCDEQQFEGILQHIVYIRNVCAHHSRLWNRKLTKTIPQPKTKPRNLASQCNFATTHDANRRIYNTLVFLLCFMDQIAPNHHWRQRLLQLIHNHSSIPLQDMGFPQGWQSFPIWQI